jgi:thiamine-monophosphate kinase
VGWKSAAQNLADLAAMGAVPTGLVVGLVAPGTTLLTWVEGLADGLAAACAGTGAAVVGGDLSSGDGIVVSGTALGDLEGRAPVLRSGAKAGDTVGLAGRVGWSAAGLALLEAGRLDVAPQLVAAHLRPQPPYSAGPAAARAGATAMLDVSDGLLRDAGRIADDSGVTLDLDVGVLTELAGQLAEASEALGDKATALRWLLTGGEDHPLLATFTGSLAEEFTTIGVVRERGAVPVLVDGRSPEHVVQGPTGWDHYAG